MAERKKRGEGREKSKLRQKNCITGFDAMTDRRRGKEGNGKGESAAFLRQSLIPIWKKREKEETGTIVIYHSSLFKWLQRRRGEKECSSSPTLKSRASGGQGKGGGGIPQRLLPASEGQQNGRKKRKKSGDFPHCVRSILLCGKEKGGEKREGGEKKGDLHMRFLLYVPGRGEEECEILASTIS